MRANDKDGKLANRRVHIAASVSGVTVGDRILGPGSGVSVGPQGSNTEIELPNWTQPPLVLISGGRDPSLRLQPGMRVNMCHDNGEGRLVGTFEELVGRNIAMPIPIRVSKLNIRIAQGVSVFVHYLA
jgi:hypothetical protein